MEKKAFSNEGKQREFVMQAYPSRVAKGNCPNRKEFITEEGLERQKTTNTIMSAVEAKM